MDTPNQEYPQNELEKKLQNQGPEDKIGTDPAVLEQPKPKGNENNQPPQTYRYVFSAAERQIPTEEPPQEPNSGTSPNRLKKILLSVLPVLLSVAISFYAGFMGARFANRIDGEDKINAAPNDSDLYQSNASNVLTKEESVESVYGSAGEDVLSVSQVVNKVQDSVVIIDVKTVVNSFYGSYLSSSSGSGVIISSQGYIITCYHVIDAAKEITVTLNSGSKYAASLVGFDEATDLAILRIQPKATEPLTYAKQGCSDKLIIGEKVVAIGNPLGTLGGTVTDGIISAKDRQITTTDNQTMTLLQTNAAINQGNSGGGLFNMDGKLIGIVNAKYTATGVEGLAFAIPIDLAYTVELDLIQYGYIRGVVDHGLVTLDITEQNQEYYYKKHRIEELGVYIVNSKYDSTGLQNMDRIVSVNGAAILTTEELNALVEGYLVGDTVTLEIQREGTTFTYRLTLREYIPDHIHQRNNQ